MLLKKIAEKYANSPEISQLLERLESPEEVQAVEGISPQSFPLIVAATFLKQEKTTVVIAPNGQRATEFASDITSFIDSELVFRFSSWDILPYEFVVPTEHIKRERIATLHRLLSGKPALIVSDTESVLRAIPTPDKLKSNELILESGEEYPFDDLLEMLVNYGFEREQRVDSYGTFSVKGGIIDIYPPSSELPLRLDFFGDTLESIRTFDLETQISKETVDTVALYPKEEILLSEAEKKELISILQKAVIDGKVLPDVIREQIDMSTLPATVPGMEDMFPLITETAFLNDLLPDECSIFALDTNEISAKRDSLIHTFNELYSRKRERHFVVEPEKLISSDSLKSLLDRSTKLQTFTSHPGALQFSLKSIPTFQGKIKEVRSELAQKIEDGWKVIISTAFEGQLRRLSDLFAEFNPVLEDEDKESDLIISLSSYSAGIDINSIKTLLLSDHDIFGKSYRRKKSFKRKSSQPLKSFLDLTPGDHVVHVNHGIGIFKKIERMSAGGFERDFLMLEYAEGDKLFVSLDQLGMIQKYIGMDGKEPRIDALGKKSAWNRIKKKVQESVEELAEELIEVYARRQALKGFRYPGDTSWQEEFEASFEYEETPDQINAIEDVKDDMESSQPMDRLICGDVGFGKTEVAIRAAFKAAMAGRQVALLVPTTILAMQHYNTFKKRFADYPVSIGLISRFRSRKDINDSKSKLAGGELDIIVGTHALLAKDMVFKNLGLLIIDEEQRFGVKHKERLKQLRTQVDVLAMSATPIPRTLHMSMAGIRDLSIILTPPENRQSVETYVLEENPDILQMAIKRELERNGQIFFIHNRVQTIDAQAEMLSELIPEAGIAVAHGQMHEHELEDIMIDFMDKKYDILVATTIVESGVDMPDVNTIIINRADSFGLAQLYQLKGRVGRSARKGYAYMFYPRHTPLTEIAQKRLRVISEYTDLGSGFKIAMKDMEIRGAGNILGKQQSGNIMDVGFDLYCQMLDEAVSRLKGEKPKSGFRTPVFIKTDNYIPEEYIGDQMQKIEFYKRFEACQTLDEIETLTLEMNDRFGEHPDTVQTLIELETLRTIASQLGIEEIIEGETSIRIRMGAETTIPAEVLIKLIQTDERFMMDPQSSDTLIFYPKEKEIEKKLAELKKWLQDQSNFSTEK